jgi:hypothetical protein
MKVSFKDKYFQWFHSEELIDLFSGPPQKKNAWLQRAWLLGLFIIGFYLWGQFLSFGNGLLNIHDWADIFGPRLAVLQAALINKVLPLHSSLPVMDGKSLRYLAIPDQILSPQIFLLPWLGIKQFIMLQVWIMYTLGFIGLLLLRKRFLLSLLSFTILFALFTLNGNILTHISVGHASWGGYFLFPFFVLLVFDLLEAKGNSQWVAKVSFLSFFILLQGSFHQFIWILFFLGLLAIAIPRHFRLLAVTILSIVLVSFIRLLPAVTLFGDFNNSYIAGYPLVQSIWQYMTQLQVPYDITTTLNLTNSIGVWEYTFFIGLFGALFILYFGVLRPLISREDQTTYRILLIPCLGLTLLSLDMVYRKLLNLIPLPIFTVERVSSRIFILAYVFILIIAVIQFQRWLERNRLSLLSISGMLALVVMGANDLKRNETLWSVKSIRNYFPNDAFSPELYYPANQYGDRGYINLLLIGLIVSLVSSAILIILAWRERRNALK